jgi:hypothetical protein
MDYLSYDETLRFTSGKHKSSVCLIKCFELLLYGKIGKQLFSELCICKLKVNEEVEAQKSCVADI